MPYLKQQGLSLIELIVFIVIMGIISVGLLSGMSQVLKTASTPEKIIQANFLANARLELVMMARGLTGFATLSDPCAITPSPSICAPLSAYASANGFTVSSISISGSNPKIISVTVSGAAIMSTQTMVYNYANN